MSYILAFDPVPDHCALIQELLKRSGMPATCHSDPARAVAAAHELFPSLILVDLEDDTALAVLRELQPLLSEHPVPLIALYAGRTEPDVPGWAFAAKIRKPIDQATLLRAIERARTEQT